LTYHPGADLASGWTLDGKAVFDRLNSRIRAKTIRKLEQHRALGSTLVEKEKNKHLKRVYENLNSDELKREITRLQMDAPNGIGGAGPAQPSVSHV
jgi:hypothetical protein